MNRPLRRVLTLAALTAASSTLVVEADAQCTTCASPTVAYYQPAVQPTVAYQPVVTYQEQSSWYLGRMFDRWRLRRYNRRAARSAATATAAAPYTVGYAPTVYTPTATPYVTAYAPMQRAVTQTTYQPVTSVSSCSGCAQTTYRPIMTQTYAPATVYRPVVMRPVIAASPIVQTGCNTCMTSSPCSACDSGSACSSCSGATTVYGTSTYGASSGGCSSCAGATPSITYPSSDAATLTPSITPSITPSTAGGSSGPVVGPTTPQPTLEPSVATPDSSYFRGTGGGATEAGAAETPTPAEGEASGASTRLEAPQLLQPKNADRTARRPSVDVWQAVYQKPATNAEVRPTSAKRAARPLDAEENPDGWYAPSRGR
ncbi:MAG: hypothetical protein AAF961_04595 [Planctomycetota bacterium]